MNPFLADDASQADVILVLDTEDGLDQQSQATHAGSSAPQTNEDKGMIIGDPDMFFANPLGRNPSQVVMAAIKEQHQELPVHLTTGKRQKTSRKVLLSIESPSPIPLNYRLKNTFSFFFTPLS